MQPPRLRIVMVAIALVFISTGCSATTIVSLWSNPAYVSPRFGRVFVVGVSSPPSIRRTFEDEFVARLVAAGVDAVPSYRFIPEDGRAAEARLQEAVRLANADAALVTRLVRVEKRTNVTPGYFQPAPAVGLGFYDGYAAAWLGYYEPPRIYQYDVYISETSLYDIRRSSATWRP